MAPQLQNSERRSPGKVRRLLRLAALAIGGLLSLFLLAIMAITMTSPGKVWLASTISSVASSEQQQVEITGLNGILSGSLGVDRVRLSDNQGAYLEIDGIGIEWSPLSLITAQFNAQSISVDRVALLRLPASSDDTPASDNGGSAGLPIEIDIASFRVGQIEIAEPVAGVAAALRLDGNLKVTGSPIEIGGKVQAQKTSGSDGEADLTFAYRPEAGEAGIDLAFSEAADGLLAGILNLPDKPSTAIRLSGQGPLSNWQVDAGAEVGGEAVLDLAGSAGIDGSDARLSLNGSGFPEKLSPPAYRDLLAGRMQIDLAAQRDGNGRIQVQTAKLDFGKFFAAATGTFDPEGQNSITGGLSAKQAAINLAGVIPGVDNLAPKDIAFSIEGSGEAASVEITGDIPLVDAGTVALIGLRTRLFAPSFNLSERKGNFEIEAELSEARSDNEQLAKLLQGATYLSVNGMAEGERIRLQSVEAINRGIEASAEGVVELAPFAIELSPTVTVQPGALPAPLSDRLNQPVTASADISAIFAEIRTIQVADLSVDGASFQTQGNASLSGEDVEMYLATSISDLQSLVPQASGAAEVIMQANGPLTGPLIDLEASSDRIEVNGKRIEDLALAVSGAANMDEPDLTLTLSGAVDGLPISGDGRFHMVDDQRVLEEFRIENGDNQIIGQLAFDDAFVPSGELSFDLQEIRPLAALALQEANGSISGSARFSNDDGAAIASLKASSANLVVAGNRLASLSADIKAQDYLSRPVLSGTVRLKELMAGTTSVNDLHLDLDAEGLNTDFDLTAKVDTMPLEVNGMLAAGDQPMALRIDTAKTVFKGIQVAIEEPVTVELPSGGIRIQRAAITIGGGQVVISGSAGDMLDLDIRLDRVDAGIVNAFASDLGAQGRVSGTVDVTGKASDPVADFDISLSGAQVAQMRSGGVDPVDIKINGKFANRSVRFDANASGNEGLSFNAGGSVALESGPGLDLKVNGNVPFAILAVTLAQNGVSLTGNAEVNMTVTGNAQQPAINGRVVSQGARLVHAPSGIAIEDLATQIDLTGESVSISSLTGNLSSGGQLSGQGSVSLSGDRNFPADISVDVRNAVYSDGRIVNTKLDANLSLKGPLIGEPSLTGQVDLGRTVITVPDGLPSSVSRLNVQHRNADQTVRQQAESLEPESSGSNASGLTLDVIVNAPNQIFIRGRGIDAELGGRVELFGPLSAPQADGGFDLIRGRLDLLDRRLDFTSGNATFSGSLIPDIDIRAETQVEETAITVRVFGPANAPEFALSSSPALAEDEILARLIFRRDIENLSALQIAQLAQAAAVLAGKGGNSSLMSRFQNLLGVDNIDIRTDAESGETTVGVGKYINDRTYIGVEQGESAGTSKATINLDIGQGLKLRGEASQSGESKAGIFYEREY